MPSSAVTYSEVLSQEFPEIGFTLPSDARPMDAPEISPGEGDT